MSTPNIDAQIKKVHKALTEVGFNIGYQCCVKIALAIVNKSVPKAPIDTGHLRNSSTVLAIKGRHFIKRNRVRTYKKRRTVKKILKQQEDLGSSYLVSYLDRQNTPVALVSFLALYAPFVHEGNPSFNWNDGGPKFLERGVNEVIPLIPTIVRSTQKENDLFSGISERLGTQNKEGEG